jgi:hypothetical protein
MVDRARALEPGTDAVQGTLIGAVRSVGGDKVEDVWCTAADGPGITRCESLVGAVLGTGLGDHPAAPPAAETREAAQPPRPSPSTTGPITLFGRSVSFPTACTAKKAPDGGDATCKDGVSLSWRAYEEMEEATQAVEATLDALGVADDPSNFSCTIAGETAQCAEHAHAVAGITYVDGKAVAVLCLDEHASRDHSLCRAVLIQDP